ncbi:MULTISPECIES: UvrD-helicase domain-containing protein [unclassified Nocardia]|uniref:UvrD-helicase domain-containing protein n=1 Tax=unclassified Nocardia TaxID=2637762 RepID=UPI00278C8388|nr:MULTISPECIES: UvrD-helicase domain-containing protein [unclassified Nocardia]
MAQLAIHRDFMLDFAKLEPPVQKRTVDLLTKFESTKNTGAHLEKIKNARNSRYRSVRIDDFWRGIVLAPESGDLYTLLKVLPHDDAYQWACRRSISVNHADHRIEIRDDDAMSEALRVFEASAEHTPARLLAHVKDCDLTRLGIDETTLPFARALTDVDQLEAAKRYLPTTQWEVLYGLAASYTPDEVWSHLGVDVPVGTALDATDLDSAIHRSTDRVALVGGPDELMAAFADPFALWRIYLHPTQRALANAVFTGPARVTGGPGTGKTVVVLHRARRLSERSEGKLLVTTFTANLASTMEDDFDILVDGNWSRSNVTFTHVDRFAHQVVSAEHGRLTILNQEEQAALWTEITERLETGMSAAFLAEEWRHVILAQQLTTLMGYQEAKRPGRGKRLGPQQKIRVWTAVSAFEEELAETRRWTHETVAREAARLLAGSPAKPYRHILVDEAQDLSPNQWRVLRAAVAHAPDDIFIAGDTHQRIYDNRVTLREVGVFVSGRSRRLPINYRTTAEILGWSLALLRGEQVDDMMEGLDSIAGCRSDVHGRSPIVVGFDTARAEIEHIVKRVRDWVDHGVAPEEIGIAVRAAWYGRRIEKALRAANLDAVLLDRNRHLAGTAVATMHRMKGLEFRCLITGGIGAKQVPEAAAVTPAVEDEHKHRLDIQRERCLLFVACTRAREQLVVTWHGQPSEFLAHLPGPATAS